MRRYVELRDHGNCQVRWDQQCAVVGSVLDHIVSPLDGGKDEAPNLRLACSHCNEQRNRATRRRAPSARRKREPIPGLIVPAANRIGGRLRGANRT